MVYKLGLVEVRGVVFHNTQQFFELDGTWKYSTTKASSEEMYAAYGFIPITPKHGWIVEPEFMKKILNNLRLG